MRLGNSLIRVRDKGALIATPARSHLADRGSKTAEIEARKGKVTPRNKAISAPSCITSYRDFGAKYPEKWCFQGNWCEANSVAWKPRLGKRKSAHSPHTLRASEFMKVGPIHTVDMIAQVVPFRSH